MEHTQIQFRAEFSINEGKIEEFKKLVEETNKDVEANEPNTITYQFYLNKDQTKCLVHETFTCSEAALAHINSVTSQTIFLKILDVSSMNRLEVYGNPNEELQKVLTRHNPQTYNSFTGFSR
jgi:quinol monooxygenase YgiN